MLKMPHMTAIEREAYEGGYSENYGGYVIQPKRDFGRYGYYSAEHRCNITGGWVICYAPGEQYAGCNAMPGATFAWTLAQAREMIDDLNAVGGEKNAAEFWERRHARKETA